MRISRAAAGLLSVALLAFPSLAGVGGHSPGAGPGAGAMTEAKRLLEQSQGTMKYSPTALLVRFNPATPESLKKAIRNKVGGSVARSYTIVPGLELMAVGMRVEAALPVLQAQAPWVQWAEFDYVVKALGVPSDAYFNQCWGLNNTGQTIGGGDTGKANADIDAVEGWDIFTGDPNFVIAVIDTGVDYTHPDLAANIWTNPGETAGNGVDDDKDGFVDDVHGWDFYADESNPMDEGGHGTHCSGTIGGVANNGKGVAGVNWQCKIMGLRFLGPYGGTTSDAISCVQFVTQKRVKVSNNSWGGGGYSSSLYNAIKASRDVGHLFCAAAGNSGLDADRFAFYPQGYDLDNIISVAAIDNDDRIANFSNYGLRNVDLGGPGVNILSTVPGGYAFYSGTSMACPHVCGVTAMVYARNPVFTYKQTKERVLGTVRFTPAMGGKTLTGGVVNLASAMAGAGSGNPPSISILSPTSGASYAVGTTITFSGSAFDAQDGDVVSGLKWVSNIQGPIGTGATFSRSDLASGPHTITASVKDSDGLLGTASISLTISASSGIPKTPGTPTVTPLGSGSARIDWGDRSDNELGFEVQRQSLRMYFWTDTRSVGTVGAGIVTFTDRPGVGSFRYRVRAYNTSGASPWTTWVASPIP